MGHIGTTLRDLIPSDIGPTLAALGGQITTITDAIKGLTTLSTQVEVLGQKVADISKFQQRLQTQLSALTANNVEALYQMKEVIFPYIFLNFLMID